MANCARCGQEFARRYDDQRYCSMKCPGLQILRLATTTPKPRSKLDRWATKLQASPTQLKAIEAAQKGACGICGEVGDLVVDHCHQTNAFRGMLCLQCNSGIGFLRDDYELALLAMAYLLRFERGVRRKAAG